MAGSLNKVMLIGNLGRDPEIRSLNNGGKVANLSVATSDSWRDKNSGERQERTEWHRVVVFNDHLVNLIEKYGKKGMKVRVEGALQTRKWTDQSGVDKYSTEIVLQKYRGEFDFLEKVSANDSVGEGEPPPEGGRSSKPVDGPIDDDIPF